MVSMCDDPEEFREIERERDERLADEAGERLGGSYEDDESEVAGMRALVVAMFVSAFVLVVALIALQEMAP